MRTTGVRMRSPMGVLLATSVVVASLAGLAPVQAVGQVAAAPAEGGALAWTKQAIPGDRLTVPAIAVSADGGGLSAAWQAEPTGEVATQQWAVLRDGAWGVPATVPQSGTDVFPGDVVLHAANGVLTGWRSTCPQRSDFTPCPVELWAVDPAAGLRTRTVPVPSETGRVEQVAVSPGPSSAALRGALGTAWWDGQAWSVLPGGDAADWIAMAPDGSSAAFASAPSPYTTTAPTTSLTVWRHAAGQWGTATGFEVPRSTVAGFVAFDQTADGSRGVVTWYEGQGRYQPPRSQYVYPAVPFRFSVAVWTGDTFTRIPSPIPGEADPTDGYAPPPGRAATVLGADGSTLTTVWAQQSDAGVWSVVRSRWDGVSLVGAGHARGGWPRRRPGRLAGSLGPAGLVDGRPVGQP